MYPSATSPHPPDLFPLAFRTAFLHHNAITVLEPHLKLPRVRAKLCLQLYTASCLNQQLRSIFPPGWSSSTSPPPVLEELEDFLQGVQWNDGDQVGPGVDRLLRVWEMINSLQQECGGWDPAIPFEAASLDVSLPLLPTSEGRLLHLQHAPLLIALPLEVAAVLAAAGGGAEGGVAQLAMGAQVRHTVPRCTAHPGTIWHT